MVYSVKARICGSAAQPLNFKLYTLNFKLYTLNYKLYPLNYYLTGISCNPQPVIVAI